MAAMKWYQNPKIAVPVFVALIGLAGTVVTVMQKKDEPKKEGASLPQVTPTPSPLKAAPSPAPEPAVSFPVVVVDVVNDNHIAGAQVVADEQGVSTETDSHGRCTLNVRPGQGKLRVTVSRPGYKTQNVELTVFEGMDPARIRLQRG